jgi:glycosyltransferase involved in cell wall biosynthesis
MKILVLNYEYPPLGGGAGQISKSISEGLALLGHDITVLTTWHKDLEDNEILNNVKIIRLRSKRKFVYRSNPFEMTSWIFHAKRFLKNHLKTENYDLVFANFALPGGEVAYSVKLKYRIPYVIISHGHDIPWFAPEQMLWYHIFTYHWIRTIVTNSEMNFVQSNEMKTNIDRFTGFRIKDRNKIIYNGWDSSVFKSDYSKRDKEFTILFPGRLVKQKDPFTFLRALKILKNNNYKFKAHILGDGPLRKKMEQYVKNHSLTDFVEFKGWLSREEMLNEYQSGSLTVLPSLAEGMSMATLEALACGQYVITTRVSNNETLIKPCKNGDFIHKKDYEMLAGLIGKFYHKKFEQGYLIEEKKLKKYHELYEWDGIVKQYETYFNQIIKR